MRDYYIRYQLCVLIASQNSLTDDKQLNILWNSEFVRIYYATIVRRTRCECTQITSLFYTECFYCADIPMDTRQSTTKIVY